MAGQVANGVRQGSGCARARQRTRPPIICPSPIAPAQCARPRAMDGCQSFCVRVPTNVNSGLGGRPKVSIKFIAVNVDPQELANYETYRIPRLSISVSSKSRANECAHGRRKETPGHPYGKAVMMDQPMGGEERWQRPHKHACARFAPATSNSPGFISLPCWILLMCHCISPAQ